MNINVWSMTTWNMNINSMACKPVCYYQSHSHCTLFHPSASLPNVRSTYVSDPDFKLCSSRVLARASCLHLKAASTQFFGGKHGGFSHTIQWLPKQRRCCSSPRASKDVPFSFRYPQMTKKPRWWWRTLACIPYLMPLHETWMYAETAYSLHPFLENFEFLTYPFFTALSSIPTWSFIAYFIFAYLGIVRRKEWPHFFRFHVIMGLLLEIGLQVVGALSQAVPHGIYWGKLGMHFWTALAFAFLFTVFECIRCVLTGMYADVPFLCDAAYIQMPYD